jgi:hypothetical protein
VTWRAQKAVTVREGLATKLLNGMIVDNKVDKNKIQNKMATKQKQKQKKKKKKKKSDTYPLRKKKCQKCKSKRDKHKQNTNRKEEKKRHSIFFFGDKTNLMRVLRVVWRKGTERKTKNNANTLNNKCHSTTITTNLIFKQSSKKNPFRFN